MNFFYKRFLFLFSFLFIMLVVGATSAISDTQKEELAENEIQFNQMIDHYRQGIEMAKVIKKKMPDKHKKNILQKLMVEQEDDIRKIVKLRNTLPKFKSLANNQHIIKEKMTLRNKFALKILGLREKIRKIFQLFQPEAKDLPNKFS